MDYIECGDCGYVEKESEWVEIHGVKTCQHCKGANPRNWPSIEIRKLFDTAKNYQIFTNEDGLVVSVFTCAAIEILLERIIYLMALEDLLSQEVDILIEVLLNTNQGRDRRLRLFNHLGYGSFSEHTTELGYKNFLKHWNEIVDIRNKCVHGKIDAGKELTHDMVQMIIDESLAVFSGLSNKYMIATLRYRGRTEPIIELEAEKLKDTEKLMKWKKQVRGNIDLTDEVD